MREFTEPVESPGTLGGTQRDHPSFGFCRFSRVSGGRSNLYGSSIEHQHYIELTIGHSSHIRHLSYDRYHPREEIVQVAMSENQFAELITSLNSGSGVPCTIQSTENCHDVPQAPPLSKRQQINDEFDKTMKNAALSLDIALSTVSMLLTKKSAGKKDLESVHNLISHAHMQLASNASFVHKQFDESCDKTVTEAKAEVEAAFLHLIGRLGGEALQDKIAAITGISEPPSLIAIEKEPTNE